MLLVLGDSIFEGISLPQVEGHTEVLHGMSAERMARLPPDDIDAVEFFLTEDHYSGVMFCFGANDVGRTARQIAKDLSTLVARARKFGGERLAVTIFLALRA